MHIHDQNKIARIYRETIMHQNNYNIRILSKPKNNSISLEMKDFYDRFAFNIVFESHQSIYLDLNIPRKKIKFIR